MIIVPVILSGGSGTRLWPLSRELQPKQLLHLIGERTLLQQTAQRLDGVGEIAAPIVVCNNEHRFMVAEQLRQIEIEPAAIVLEPVGRNTAPAVAVAALTAAHAAGPGVDPLLLVLPADHVVARPSDLRAAIGQARPAAADGKLVTFGISPGWPETGYGYIRAGAPLDGQPSVMRVAEFVEKPDHASAEQYLAAGDFYWNSGMFLFRASRYLEELQDYQPDMFRNCHAAYAGASEDLDFLRLDRKHFSASPADSVDYAVMEHTTAAAVVPLDAGWNDVGNWSALYDVNEHDRQGNVCIGDVTAIETTDSYLHADHRLLATLGVSGVVVVETADAVLVVPRERVQDVKLIVDRLRRERRVEASLHREVYRPWGSCDSIGAGERYKVNHLTIKPGGAQSLQLHRGRAEHWVVVRGSAEVTCDDEVYTLIENQSTYIPVGSKHRISNPGTIPLELIEIQTGSQISEDDIIRYQDTYGRAGEEF